MFLKSKFMGVPVLLMDYIGALKAWIYYPLVSVAPVTPGLIRYPAIFFGLSGAVLTGLAFQRLMGRGGLLVGACLLFDPALLMHSRLDWGPTAVMFLLRGLLLWALACWIVDRRLRWLWLATVAAGLGIFDKLNFLWFASASAVALGVCYHREIWLESRRRVLPHVVVGMAVLAVGLFALSRAMAIQRGLGDTHSWSVAARMDQVVSLLKFTLAGGGVTDFVAGRGMRSAPLAIVAWSALVMSAVVLGYVTRFWRSRSWWFMLLVVLGTLGAFVLTRSATGPHHAAMLAGLPQLLLLACVYPVSSGWQGLGAKLRVTAVAVWIVCMALVSYRSVEAFAKPSNRNWDRANQHAAEYSATLGLDCITGDWGFGTLVAAYMPDIRRVHDDWPVFHQAESARLYVAPLQLGDRVVVVGHRAAAENFKGSEQNMRAAFEQNGWVVVSQRYYAGHDGGGLACVVVFEKRAAGSL